MSLFNWLIRRFSVTRSAAESRLASACARNELSSTLLANSVLDLQAAVDRHCEVTRDGTKLLNKLKTDSGEKVSVECRNCVYFKQTNCVRGVCLHPKMHHDSVTLKWHCEYWKALATT